MTFNFMDEFATNFVHNEMLKEKAKGNKTMKTSFIEKIVREHNEGKQYTLHGEYAYSIQWHPMANKLLVIRCKREDLGREWIDADGNQYNGWEWLDIEI